MPSMKIQCRILINLVEMGKIFVKSKAKIWTPILNLQELTVFQ